MMAPKAVELIRQGLKKLTRDEMKKVKEIIIQSHLKPSLKKPGLFQLTEAMPETENHQATGVASSQPGMSDNERQLLKVFDAKIRNMKSEMHQTKVDFTKWKSQHSESQTAVKALGSRVK